MKTIKKTIFLFSLIFTSAITAQNQAFKVKVVGKGDPILLFPGFTCTDAVWEDIMVELSKNHECHVFTFAGFGDVKPIEKPWLPKIKENLQEYISENTLENATIIGHSLGGTLGLWLASETNTFKKMIIVDALPSVGALMIPDFKSENMVYENPWNEQLLSMDEESFDTMATQMAMGMSLKPEKQKQIKDWILQADRQTYVYGYTDLLKLDLREDIAKIKVPVTILAATHPYGLEMAKITYGNQYKNLKTYSIEYAEGSAHFIMYDKPEWFLEKVMLNLEY
ncbi:alpha/beta fold hydrolase [Costertonia aggregata]|uniref:Alpha/beta hydrolase n=1 Tax=Costertonia aggregata TaxID=343403 RepID=A0A7H9AP42_9FLAO|nr:alpha/beta hydrolase [Costertonia aggregata]QLG45200.1 alpha/beta hydrolase [Costertonia aggregata]